MNVTDRIVGIAAGLFLAGAGVAGGLNHWARSADSLPLLIWAITLPALAVWFGQRLQSAAYALSLPACLGALFFLPSLAVYRSSNPEEDWFALALSVAIPALIGAIAFANRSSVTVKQAKQEDLRALALTARRRALIGIILFAQLLQPSVLDLATRLEARGVELGDENILQPAKTAKIIALIMLSLIVGWNLIAVLMAFSDAL